MRHYVARHLARNCNMLFCELSTPGLSTVRKVNDHTQVLRVGGHVRGLQRCWRLKRAFDALQAYQVERFAKRTQGGPRVLVNFQFDFERLYRSVDTFSLRYTFINDDFVNMYPNDPFRLRKKRAQDAVVAASRRVFVTSEPIADTVRDVGTPVTVVYSGHDFEPPPSTTRITRDTEGTMVVGFMGFLHDRLRVDWIERLATVPKCEIRLIGPVQSRTLPERLSRHRNIRFVPPLLGAELQAAMLECDVFMMPYTDEPVNQAASVPAKLFQYLACGRPVVASWLNNLIALPDDFVYRASSAAQFVDLVCEARRRDTVSLADARVRFAMDYRWERTLEPIWRLISQDLADVTDQR
jgi:glycosyltransferase involved in cell wall biosynthesis